MPRLLHDFRCANGHVDEHFVDLDIDPQVKCNTCGSMATKAITAVNFNLEGISGDFPTAADKWVKKREQRMSEEKRLGGPPKVHF
jgi:predicted nucleic acid-binding Zn ribbon protein